MVLTTALPRTPAPLLLIRLLRIELGGLLRRSARGLGIARPKPLALTDLPIPDSRPCVQATELARELESPMLFNHSVRSYLFGTAVGRHLGIKVDPELLYLASILHDIGLTTAHDGPGSFELNGARSAHSFLLDAGYDAERAARVHEAIALHAAVGVANHGSPELALVHFGAGVDVIGYRAEDVAPATRAAIVARYPRHQFKRAFGALLEDQAQRKPECHIAGHVGLGFLSKMNSAPFDE
jgi:cyanamide hydratase family protein with HD domain